MKKQFSLIFPVFIIACLLLLPVLVFAEEMPGITKPSLPASVPAHSDMVARWGTADSTMLQVPAISFRPGGSDTTFATYWNTGYMYKVAGNSMFYAPLNLPNGAKIVALGIDAYDSNATDDIIWGILRMTPDHSGDTGIAWYGSFTSAGYFSITSNLSTPHTVDHNNYYALLVNFDTIGQSTTFKGMRVYYTLQVSPAPATPTFGDVPKTHQFFQFIEALAASGITAGCGGGNFCPDTTLTRGQMAVFLSKALGLHWPDN